MIRISVVRSLLVLGRSARAPPPLLTFPAIRIKQLGMNGALAPGYMVKMHA